MSQVRVRAENLCKSFGENKAVDSVSLNTQPGEIFGIVGPDGAGKSTLLRMLSSIMEPDAGTAEVCGFNSISHADEIKNRIAYMSQRFGLYPDLTVDENIRFYAELYNVSENQLENRIDELLHFSYMHPFKKRLAGKLSGGMKQKLQLVCALIHTPEVLILDEPTNGVDPVSRRDFWRMLQNLAEKGVAIVVSTSYLDEAERCHRLALMHEGRFFVVGNLRDIIAASGVEISVWRGDSAKLLYADLKKHEEIHDIRLFGDSIRIKKGPEFASTKSKVDKVITDKMLDGRWEADENPNLEDVFVNHLENLVHTSNDSFSHFSPHPQTYADGNSVKVNNLSRAFGDFKAVDEISLEVKQGEIFGFLGPNGAGKSTTIRMLCGLLIPSSGEGTVAGFDLASESEKIKQNIGYMSQKFSLYVDLSVKENISFYGGIYGLSGNNFNRRISWALQLSGLTGLENSTVGILSLGFRQRLALACSLLHEPTIVFLDEPTSGVDPLTRRQFWETIREMAQNGITVFVTTHYMEEAEYCDRVAFINRGKIMACGSPGQLKKSVIKSNIFHVNRLLTSVELEKIRSLACVIDAYVYGTGFHVATAQNHILADIAEAVQDNTMLQEKIIPVVPGMEDVFVQLSASHFANDQEREFVS
ncbi:MAG: ATP-binding cassette domain-containing protein [Candidatus Riflebacteria bacterium]|nr:ATP-binding cassette domain-containing protein [Candidatus Riflebacteria bacterium]